MDVSQPLAYPNMIDVHKAPVKTCYMLVHYTSSLLSSSVNDSENITIELIIRYQVPSFRVDISLIGMLDCFLILTISNGTLNTLFFSIWNGIDTYITVETDGMDRELISIQKRKKLLSVWFS